MYWLRSSLRLLIIFSFGSELVFCSFLCPFGFGGFKQHVPASSLVMLFLVVRRRCFCSCGFSQFFIFCVFRKLLVAVLFELILGFLELVFHGGSFSTRDVPAVVFSSLSCASFDLFWGFHRG